MNGLRFFSHLVYILWINHQSYPKTIKTCHGFHFNTVYFTYITLYLQREMLSNVLIVRCSIEIAATAVILSNLK